MMYGYARVSTRGQQRDGNSLSAQTEALKGIGCSVVVQEAFTGTTTDRPEFDKLLAKLKEGDTLAVTKLDRIARSTIEGCSLVRELVERGITVRVLNMGTLDNTPVGKMMVSVMFAMAEFERDMIVQRTSEGKAIARQRPDYREGRPVKTVDLNLVQIQVDAVNRGAQSVLGACRALGIGRTKYYQLRKEVA